MDNLLMDQRTVRRTHQNAGKNVAIVLLVVDYYPTQREWGRKK